jgi:hypothetical protein
VLHYFLALLNLGGQRLLIQTGEVNRRKLFGLPLHAWNQFFPNGFAQRLEVFQGALEPQVSRSLVAAVL